MASPTSTDLDNYFLNIAYTRTISNAMLNEFRFTGSAQPNLQEYFPAALTHRSRPRLSALGVTPDQPTGPPNLYFDTGLYIGYSEQGPTTEANNTFSYADTFSWVKGKHNWKFGAGFTPYENNTLYDYYVNGEFDFDGPGGNSGTARILGQLRNSYADFLARSPGSLYQYPSAPSNIRSKNTFLLRVKMNGTSRRRLVLNLGVRYEYSTPKLDTAGPQLLRHPRTTIHSLPQRPDRPRLPGRHGRSRLEPTSPIRMTGRRALALPGIPSATARPAFVVASASSTTSSKAKITSSSTGNRRSSPQPASSFDQPTMTLSNHTRS